MPIPSSLRASRARRAARLAARSLARLTAVAALLAAAAGTARAQRAIVVHGTVRDSAGAAVAGARITAIARPAGDSALTRTDSAGTYRLRLRSSGAVTGIAVATVAVGFAPSRAERAVAGDSTLTVDVRLTRVTARLGDVKVTANRAQKPQLQDYGQAAAGDATQYVGMVASPADRGNLAAMAATTPGIALVPGTDGAPAGFSVLGLSSSQNNVTLNGIAFGGADIPRTGQVATRVSTSSYDPAVGGFSGGLLSVFAYPGSNFTFGTLGLSLDDPALQHTDRVGAQLGQRYRNLQLSGSRTGPIVRDKLFYNVSGQAGRRTQPVATLANGSALALASAGVSRATSDQLLSTLASLGVPAGDVADASATRSGSFLGRFDVLPTQTRTIDLVTSARWSDATPVQLSPRAVPGHGGRTRSWSESAQGEFARYVENRFLTRTRVGVSGTSSRATALSLLPEGQVLAGSTLPDGGAGLTTLQFGGAGSLPRRSDAWSWEATHETSWYVRGDKHRLKIAADLRGDRYATEQTVNGRGTFTFPSLDALAAGQPSSFTRTFGGTRADGAATSLGLSLGDYWRAFKRISFQYGARLDGTRFGATPRYNPALDSALDVRTDRVPSSLAVSPRLGFTWAYGREKSGVGAFYQRPRAVVSGGAGAFRGVFPSTLLAPARIGTGLADATRRLVCVGAATPAPAWDALAADPATDPTACVGDATITAATLSPDVTTFARDYTAPVSWRTNLGWSGRAVGPIALSATALYSLSLHQPSQRDLNFAGVRQFALADEDGRPVFVAPTAAVPATGALDVRAARLAPALGRVTSLGSDLRSESRQVSLALTPSQGNFFGSSRYWTLRYAYTRVRDQARGFDGAAFDDPRTVSWGRSTGDVRHQINGTFGWPVSPDLFFGANMQLRSGTPFTPLVGGDVNGDGLSNDRAFVFDPAATADSAVAAGMTRLLGAAPRNVANCLRARLGHAAVRNGCTGPWTASMNASANIGGRLVGLGTRSRVSLTFTNVLAGIDALVHGEGRERGWGQPALPDPTLLAVRGFDAASRRFVYSVNPNFGDTRPGRSALRSPFQVTLDVYLPLGATQARQLLDQVVRPGRGWTGKRLTADQVAARYRNSGLPDPIRQIVAAKDSLQLTADQQAALVAIGARYRAAADSAWMPLARHVAGLGDRYDQPDLERRARLAQDHAFDALAAAARSVRELLTPDQVALLAPEIASLLDERSLRNLRRNYF